jgi:hypothetical protein
MLTLAHEDVGLRVGLRPNGLPVITSRSRGA